jgi:lipopolysaccharide export system permease protein
VTLLDRYVTRQFLRTFLGLVLGLPLLFVIGDITDNIDKYMARGIPMGRLALSYVFQLPLFIVYCFPIAALVGTVFTIGAMTRHQEVAAAKAGGISFHRIILPVLAMGVLLSGVAMGLSELVPITLARRAELLGESSRRDLKSRNNFVYQTEGEGVLAARRLEVRDQNLSQVVLERNATAKTPGMHRVAESAHWTPGGGWMLKHGYIRWLPAAGPEIAVGFDSVRVPGLVETPEELLAEPRDPEEMGYRDVARFVDAIERSGGDANSLRVELAQKIAVPCAVLIIVLFGAPLATSSQRGGAAFGVGISLGVTILYMLLFRVARAIGGAGSIDPTLAAWAPNLLFLAAGLVLMTRVRT